MNSYVQQNLGRDERLILMMKPHWIALLPHIPLILVYGLGFITMIPVVIRMLTTVIAFSNRKVMCKRGLINTIKMDSPLNQVNNVAVTSGLFGKIFGYGNLIITTASGTHAFKGIKSPEEFRKALIEQIQLFEEDKAKKQAEEMAKAMKAASTV